MVNVVCDMLGGGIAIGEPRQVIDAPSGGQVCEGIGQQASEDVEVNYDAVSVEFVSCDDGLDTPFVVVRRLWLARKNERVGGSKGRLDGNSVCH